MKIPKTPSELKSAGRKFWKMVHSEQEFSEGHERERLKMAGGCLDEIADNEKIILLEGHPIMFPSREKTLF